MTGRPRPDDRVSAFLDGELDAVEQAEVGALVDSDASWHEEAESIGAVRERLRSAPRPAVPEGFWAEVGAAVEAAAGTGWEGADAAVTAIDDRRGRRWDRWQRWVAGSAVAAGVLVVAMVSVPEREAPTSFTPSGTTRAPVRGVASFGSTNPPPQRSGSAGPRFDLGSLFGEREPAPQPRAASAVPHGGEARDDGPLEFLLGPFQW